MFEVSSEEIFDAAEYYDNCSVTCTTCRTISRTLPGIERKIGVERWKMLVWRQLKVEGPAI
jgi:hypothetical protein